MHACAWGLRTVSTGYAEGGWRVVTSMRSVADLLASRSCNEAHWHRPVEGVFPPAASFPFLCRRLMPIFLWRPAPVELAELVAGATVRRRLRGKQSIQRRLTGKQPPGSSLSQPSNSATETVPEVEELPVMRDETEPWRPLTEAEKTTWDARSPEEREVCALVHRLHRELGHSDIRGMVDSLRQNHAHPTVLAAAKLKQCTACQESARLVSRPVSSREDHGVRSGPTDGQFLLEAPHEGGACESHAVGGCLFERCGGELVVLETRLLSGSAHGCCLLTSRKVKSRRKFWKLKMMKRRKVK